MLFGLQLTNISRHQYGQGKKYKLDVKALVDLCPAQKM